MFFEGGAPSTHKVYFSGEEVKAFRRSVKGVVFVSPVGIPTPPELELTRFRRVVAAFWDRGVTPFLILRILGPLGLIVARMLSRWRLSRLHEDAVPIDVEVSAAYVYYQATSLPPVGEFSLSRILAPMAYARRPLGARLIQAFDNTTEHTTWPKIRFLYGGRRDWMNSDHAIAVVERARRAGLDVTLTVDERATHQVAFDAPDAVINTILEIS